MRKKLHLILIFFTISTIAFAKDIYVSTTGDDNNNGSITNPYKTFSKAVSVMSAGDVCIIREGIYEQELVVDKNGNANNFLTFKAAEGEQVEIKATTKINGWQLYSGNIYKTTVNMSISSRFRAVYHNQEYMDLARWPNNTDNNRWTIDCTPVTNGNGSYFTANNIPNIDWAGGLVYYLGAHSGASWTRTITASSTTRIDFTEVDINKWPFNTHNPTTWRNYPGNERGQMYLFNKLEALDHAREWYYDNASNTLYLQTADGNKPANDSVEYATRIYNVQLNGDYIKLEGIHFYGGSIKIHNNADNNQILNCSIIHGSEGHDDLTNTSAQVGEAAIEVLGDNTLIKGCTINHSSVNGIVISGWAASNCTVEQNTISNIDYVGIHASPIRTSGDQMKVLKNTIYNAGRDGMYVAGSNSEVAYNDVSASQKINSDSGVFYTVGNDNLKNNEIHHNWFHDASAPSYSHNPTDFGKAAGIYLDNNSKGYTVHHNVIWNVSWSGYQVNWNNTDLDFYHNTIWNSGIAMDSWVNGYNQENNKIYNNFASSGEWFTETATDFDIQNNLITATSPFEDADTHNFMPKAGSSVLEQGQVISGFTKPYKGAAPDIGAYERGGTQWTAGINAIEDTGEGMLITITDIQFTIKTTSETCPNENNGKATIVADLSGNYTANFNGNNINFTKELTLENITPESYDLCISLQKETKSQCSKIIIAESNNINAITTITKDFYNVEITNGTPPFTVFVNDHPILETYSTHLQIPILQGDIIKVNSKNNCEGAMIESIDFYKNLTANPNPTTSSFSITLPVDNGEIPIEIFNTQSQLISSKVHTIENGIVTLNLDNEKAGMYFVKIISKEPKVIKVLKR
ncbi:right-handed parallel beta-helix repeat-containing protein [Wenyingzhuangia sp. 1_MG-2023]|nr:right-handed parallel beta-helix repeat-containing protein [Wenyingzhuangia sp. 1_MG-2023]